MELDFESCNRARLSRDARFDGRFFVAVRSTGIYCRPVCPAPRARLQNVLFFPCAAAAQEAGFRPCRRCRPETAPGTPAWQGTSTTVSRALKLISEGYLDRRGVDDLAQALGIGDRHLRRLFFAHLGASPNAVAATHRLHFAIRLIEETSLPMATVAFGSGFASLRRFNAAIRETFGGPPSTLRRQIPEDTPRTRGNSILNLQLAYRPPFQWNALLGFLGKRAIPGVEEVRNGAYRRTFALAEARGVFAVANDAATHSLRVNIQISNARELLTLVEKVRSMFDLSADPLEVGACLARDPALASLVRRHPGLRLPGTWDAFELAVRAILGQQISVAAASTLAGRLAARFGKPFPEAGGTLSYLFPGPETLYEADLSAIGIPRARAETIRSLARAVAGKHVRLDAAQPLDQAVRRLCEIPGIGEWTANYIAMRALQEPDAFPAADLGVMRALAKLERRMSPRAISRRAEVWRPWRAYAVMYLWTYE
jgi:AraC family transcriptional regulator of adaptative response / DNA-3-methyladenine glycosylase II